MNNLPKVPLPEDFELGVFTKSMLASLPAATVPASFESSVLRSAKSSGSAKWFVSAASIAFIIAVGSIVIRLSEPDVITVSRVPNIEQRYVNLENLPPATVYEYPTQDSWASGQQSNPSARNPSARKPFGVAGH